MINSPFEFLKDPSDLIILYFISQDKQGMAYAHKMTKEIKVTYSYLSKKCKDFCDKGILDSRWKDGRTKVYSINKEIEEDLLMVFHTLVGINRRIYEEKHKREMVGQLTN